jgi:hypothetical protein
MNSCILITSHLNDPYKEKVALELLDFLQDQELPLIFVGNSPFSKKIQSKSDYTLNIKENPRGTRFTTAWYQIPSNVLDMECRLNKSSADYGLAHLHQTLIGFKFCKSIGYDYVYHLNYDMDLQPEAFNEFIHKGKLGEPLFFNWGREENAATNIYALKSEDYIDALEPKLDLYKNESEYLSTILPEDWFAETFFRWVMEDYYKEKLKITTDIEFTSKVSHNYGDLDTPLGVIRIFSINESQYILWFITNPHDITNTEFSIGENKFFPISTPHPHFFFLDRYEGEYYVEDKFIFNSTPDLFDHTWVQPT